MIDLENNRLILGDKTEPILRWEVYFMTPFGLHTDLASAVQRMKECDMPVHVIQAHAVAISESTYEVKP